MKVFLDRKNFNKNIKGVVKSDKEIYLRHKEKVFDELLPQVKEFMKGEEYISISKLQRVFGIGFPRAYRIMQQLIYKNYVNVETKYRVNENELNEEYRQYLID